MDNNNRDFSVGDHDSNLTGRYKEDRWDSSENYDGASGDDDQENAQRLSGRRRKYHRHTGHQIQELEAYFKECPHPDEKQRLELSRRLSLETNQVKFWFQNRRTQLKTQMERHENIILKQENDKLRVENIALKDAMRNPLCKNCGGSAPISDISYEEHHLRIENAKMKDEINRLSILAGRYMGRPSVFSVNHTAPLGANSMDFPRGLSVNNEAKNPSLMDEIPCDRPMLFTLARVAMEELTKKVHIHSPLWIKSIDGETSILSYEDYLRTFPPCIGTKPAHFVVDATKQSCVVNVDSESLLETFMDVNRWSEMFPCLVAKAITIEELSPGLDGTKDGALQIIHAELQVLSPLVSPRVVKFLRFCKQQGDGIWAVVDMSIDNIRSGHNSRRLPSGCIMQDMANGYSKVIWVEHTEYDPTVVPTMFRPLVSSGMGYGAQRWISTLQRQCESLSLLVLPSNPPVDGLPDDQSQVGRTNLLKLSQRMVDSFSAGIYVSPNSQWAKIHSHHLGEDVKVMTRKSFNNNVPGELPGLILSASTSLRMPVPMQRLYDFLRDEQMRSAWDILADAGHLQEMVHIPKSQYHNNGVSLLHVPTMEENNTNIFVLQETWMDASGSLVVYAPVDVPTVTCVLNGGNTASVALLPSGFTIHPDVQPHHGTLVDRVHSCSSDGGGGNGSLLTVGFQILTNSLPSMKLSIDSLETVDYLLSCIIGKIQAALV